MTRGQAKVTDNSEYLAFVRQNYLNRLKENLPKTVLDKTTWLSPPQVLVEVNRNNIDAKIEYMLYAVNLCLFFPLQTSEILRKLHYRLMVRKYVRGITPQRKTQVANKYKYNLFFY